ncbi:hypothetical protein WA026_016134 [Henosepilachna vigintioctopunctata]|uniref:RRM domain-containing protein n=1 Tax=Henosepilachna vigintioctopunctata TaxID=420089 RepID=A0AAW1TMU2_9CUCU
MAHHKKKGHPDAKLSVKDILRLRKKESKRKLREKRARLVIKNLPFDTTEENLREHFSKYGDIFEVKVLKKEDGKSLGCGFIQFKLVQRARKAKHYTDGQPFLGRNIDVDFAMAKKKYEKIKVKKELEIDPNIKIKEEPMDAEFDNIEKSDEKDEIVKLEDSAREIDPDDNVDSDENNSDDSIESSDEEDVEELEVKKEYSESRTRIISNDVSEGKTIFVKNVPFTATNKDLKECMLQFGPIYYALICIDKLTEHSKGTAFVKFCFKEDAEKALEAGTELTLMGSVLDCHKALDKKEIKSKLDAKESSKSAVKDSRNLYLVKEGVVMAGSKAAEGVSGADMTKRLKLEQYKSQILKNLNMFVSRVRLAIHNIPQNWDDKKLRSLCERFVNQGVKIIEVRIMRDFNNVNAEGIGKSKEFGFVTLDTHENALSLLRKLNNNPNIFSKSRRPIVSFSIEKRSAIKTKLKRLEKSRLKNPKSKFFNPDLSKKENENIDDSHNPVEVGGLNEFSGISAELGVQKMRSNYKLSAQAKKHSENMKKEKKKLKLRKKTLKEKKKEFTKQERQKIGKSKDDYDDFSKLVSNYKKTISGASSLKSKWYT